MPQRGVYLVSDLSRRKSSSSREGHEVKRLYCRVAPAPPSRAGMSSGHCLLLCDRPDLLVGRCRSRRQDGDCGDDDGGAGVGVMSGGGRGACRCLESAPDPGCLIGFVTYGRPALCCGG